MSIAEGPVQKREMRKEGRIILEGRKNAKDKGIRGYGGGNRLGEGKVKCIDNDQVGNDGGEVVIRRHINIIFTGKGIGGAHLRAKSNYPFNVEVLEK